MSVQKFTFDDFKKQSPMSNHYISHAEEMWEDIEEYKNNPNKYKSHYLSILINAYELYMKGLLEIKLDDTKSGYKLSPSVYKDLFSKHRIKFLAHEIDNQGFASLMPANIQKIGDFDRLLENMQRKYTSSRYDEFSEYQEFAYYYDLIKIQRSLILESLKVEKKLTQSEQLKQTININDEEYNYD